MLCDAMIESGHRISVASLALAALLLLSGVDVRAAGNSSVCGATRTWDNATSLAGCDFRDDSTDPVTRARRFIDASTGMLKMALASADLVHLETVQGLAGRHVRFQQFLFGYPVYNAIVSVREDAQGRVRGMQSGALAALANIAAGRMNVDQDGAAAIARQLLAQQAAGAASGVAVRVSRQVWYPRADGQVTLAWEILITADRPLLDYRMIIDRATGEVLLRQDRLVRWVAGPGKVFRANPIQVSGDATLTGGSSAPTINALATIEALPGLAEGTGKLRGRFVDTSVPSLNLPQANYPVADEPTRQYYYDVAEPRFLQVNAYYAIDSAQRYLGALGFTNDRTVQNGIRNYPTIAYPSWDGLDNSFYRPTTDTLHFGEGGVPDAEDGDLIVHEYGHAIQQAQLPTWGCTSGTQCEMRAMGEGFSDYFAAVVHAGYGKPAYQDDHAACIAEWDSTTYSATNPPCLRRVDGQKVYPTDLVGEIHRDGEIWSRALWDIRNAIGGNVASQIIIEHHYRLVQGATMPQAAVAMLDVDAELFGGFNEIPLRQAFCARGILAGADCVLPADPTIVVPASKDTLVRQSATNRNEGQSPMLRLKGGAGTTTRLLFGFDLAGIDLNQVKSAVLELTIVGTDDGWGIFGRTIDAHPLLTDFTEGNGVQAGADPVLMTLGTGPGVTWNCPNDQDISNSTLDCAAPWNGGAAPGSPFPFGTQTPSAVQTNAMTDGRLRWTVTADVKAGVSRWVVKKTFEDKIGRVDVHSREGALAVDPYDLAGRRPRLILTLN